MKGCTFIVGRCDEFKIIIYFLNLNEVSNVIRQLLNNSIVKLLDVLQHSLVFPVEQNT